MPRFQSITPIIFLLAFFSIAAFALAAEEILPPDQAFRLSAQHGPDNAVELHWDIAAGYYLYKNKFQFLSESASIKTGDAEFPKGKIKSDDYFVDVEIYREAVDVSLPLEIAAQAPETSELTVTYQGCADIGVCYPPIKTELKLPRPQSARVDWTRASTDSANPLQNFGFDRVQNELLPADQAFRFFATVKDGNALHVDWEIADGYYLYREKFKFDLANAESVALGEIAIPKGTEKYDEEFGNVEIFHGRVELDLPLIRNQAGPLTINLIARFQGCAEIGVCYPPMKQSIALELPSLLHAAALSENPAAGAWRAAAITGSPLESRNPISEQDQIALALHDDSLAFTMLVFFGYGLLLAFTPCVFPMVPILSGIIVGHGHTISTSRAFGLSS
ncbi:MAG: protein-disulfide reductase DsbD domain-containing protein, partial [Methylococcales bacterium]